MKFNTPIKNTGFQERLEPQAKTVYSVCVMIICTVLEKLQAPQLVTVPHIVWNPKVNCPVHKSPPHVHILRQINLVHTLPSYFFNIYFNIIPPFTCRSSKWIFPSGFPPKPCRHISSAHTSHMLRPSHSSLYTSPEYLVMSTEREVAH